MEARECNEPLYKGYTGDSTISNIINTTSKYDIE